MTEVRFWPAARRPRLAALVAAGIGFVGAVSWHLVPPLVALSCTAALVGSLASFFLPTTYRFEEEGIRVERLGGSWFLPWRRFRSFAEDRNGFYLSPASCPRRFELRGFFLPLDRQGKERVLPLLRKRLPQRAQAPPVSRGGGGGRGP